MIDIYVKVNSPENGRSTIEVSFESNEDVLKDLMKGVADKHEIRYCNLEINPNVRLGMVSKVCESISKGLKPGS